MYLAFQQFFPQLFQNCDRIVLVVKLPSNPGVTRLIENVARAQLLISLFSLALLIIEDFEDLRSLYSTYICSSYTQLTLPSEEMGWYSIVRLG
ncbi:hypothetical protein B7486_54860 [cyanobacterium TDX16]|nr:hypothetical protein B7486_54860 [cyanobacterium TDX16]